VVREIAGRTSSGAGERGKRNEEHTSWKGFQKLSTDLQAQPRLAAPSWTGQRDEPFRVRQHRRQLGELRLATDERIRRDREVRRVEASERGEVLVAELVDAFGRRQVPEPVVSEVAHADADRSRLERGLSVDSRGKRIRSLREGDEERISLRVHLDAAVPAEALTQRLSMLAERVRVGVAELVQQPRRPLDVREQERDGPGGQLAHTGMMRRLEPKV
jgi:hypothetical protein